MTRDRGSPLKLLALVDRAHTYASVPLVTTNKVVAKRTVGTVRDTNTRLTRVNATFLAASAYNVGSDCGRTLLSTDRSGHDDRAHLARLFSKGRTHNLLGSCLHSFNRLVIAGVPITRRAYTCPCSRTRLVPRGRRVPATFLGALTILDRTE